MTDPRLLPRDHILKPWIVGEGISTSEARKIAGKSEDTVRRWCDLWNIGRRVAGGFWTVSRPALDMVLVGDEVALVAYLRGERDGVVRGYFERAGLGAALALAFSQAA